MLRHILGPCVVALAVTACGSSNDGTEARGGDAGVSGYAGQVAGGHSVTLHATLAATNGELSFLSPAGSILRVAAKDIIGKPYLVAAYPVGFAAGNDPALDSTWSTVPSNLEVTFTTPSTYKDGAYDLVLIIYVTTPITDAIRHRGAQFAPAATRGDLSTFTADVHARPLIVPGTVRVQVKGANASIEVGNHVPADTTNNAEIAVALTNTVMIVP